MDATEAERLREEANSGVKDVPDNLRFDEAALAEWMAANVEGYEGPLEVRQFKGGQSNPTYQLVTPRAKYVMRKKPPGKLLPSAHAVDREFKVLSGLYPTGFPVARPYGLCTDDAVVGTMFYVMQMVEGRILWDQTLPQYAPAERHAIYMAKLKTLADLHNTDHEAIGLGDYGKPGNYMARQVDRWSKQYRASETARNEDMERLMAWLPQSAPVQERTSIVHGDFRIDNMIFDAAEPRVAAVLDWELSTLGEPLADFTYVLMHWVYGSLTTVPDLKAHGIPPMDEYVAEYCRLTNRTGLHDVDWFLAFNMFRLSAIFQGIVGRVRAGTANHPQAAEYEQKMPILAELAWSYAKKAGA